MRALTRVLATVCALSTAAASAPEATGARGGTCRLDGARVLARSSAAIVFQRSRRIVACDRRSGRRSRLNRFGPVRSIRATRRFVGYLRLQSARDGSRGVYLLVLDVSTGKRVIATESYTGSLDPATNPGFVSLTDFIVLGTGEALWISPAGASGEYEVGYARPREGLFSPTAARPLDRGADVEPGSLATNGTFAYWRRGGVANGIELALW